MATDQQVKVRAYQLWELAGRPEGRDAYFYQEAERELKESTENNSPEPAKNDGSPT